MPFSRLNEDRALTEATRFRLPDAAPVGKLRVDVGWKFWKKGPEDEIEGAAVEFVIKFYNAAVRHRGAASHRRSEAGREHHTRGAHLVLVAVRTQGEEVQSAGTNEREAAGVAVGRPEPEEAEEAAEEEPPAEEEPAEGEGEVSACAGANRGPGNPPRAGKRCWSRAWAWASSVVWLACARPRRAARRARRAASPRSLPRLPPSRPRTRTSSSCATWPLSRSRSCPRTCAPLWCSSPTTAAPASCRSSTPAPASST